MRISKLYISKIAVFIFISIQMGYAQDNFFEELSCAAMELTNKKVVYDPNYFVIKYPNGDIPSDLGVCTDVIIRAYRKLGIDLQKEVHEDMKANFDIYPKNWGLSKPDTNIDHRRVPNLMKYFSRFGTIKPITYNKEDYLPGDIVCWDLGQGTTHIGVVVNQQKIVHNIGKGQVLQDCLFDYKIIGHFKYNNN